MTLVKCRTLFNETRYVPAEKLVQRPSVYGIVVHERQLLLAQARSTQKFVLPGGGIEKGEPVTAALRREIWEETGIQAEIGEFLHFETDLFYYDPQDLALHGFLFYYRCTPVTTALNPPAYPAEEDLAYPLWADIERLRAADFQAHGELVLRLVQQCLL